MLIHFCTLNIINDLLIHKFSMCQCTSVLITHNLSVKCYQVHFISSHLQPHLCRCKKDLTTSRYSSGQRTNLTSNQNRSLKIVNYEKKVSIVMVNNSTNIDKTNNHPHLLTEHKKAHDMSGKLRHSVESRFENAFIG